MPELLDIGWTLGTSPVTPHATSVVVDPAPSRHAGTSEAVEFTLPAPTGPYRVGSTELHLIDRDRPDPWVPERKRELMVSVFDPAAFGAAERYPRTPWMRPGAAVHFDQTVAPTLGIQPGDVDWAGDADPRTGRWPTTRPAKATCHRSRSASARTSRRSWTSTCAGGRSGCSTSRCRGTRTSGSFGSQAVDLAGVLG